MSTFSLGDRMKRYEAVSQLHLTRRVPVIIRVDGRAFHGLIGRHFGEDGYCSHFVTHMQIVSLIITHGLQGCRFAYGQSDEVSFLLTDYRTISTDPHFDYNLQKLVSTTASAMTVELSRRLSRPMEDPFLGTFDARAFNIPQDEVVNYFLWRQRDATRNAIHMWAREHFSHKECMNKSGDEMQEMVFQATSLNFNDLSPTRKRGWCIHDLMIDNKIPMFSTDRDYIQKFVDVRED